MSDRNLHVEAITAIFVQMTQKVPSREGDKQSNTSSLRRGQVIAAYQCQNVYCHSLLIRRSQTYLIIFREMRTNQRTELQPE